MSKRVYEIPCTFEMYGTYTIEAESLEEALEIAETMDIPEHKSYIDGSYKVDTEGIPYNNDPLDNRDAKYLEDYHGY